MTQRYTLLLLFAAFLCTLFILQTSHDEYARQTKLSADMRQWFTESHSSFDPNPDHHDIIYRKDDGTHVRYKWPMTHEQAYLLEHPPVSVPVEKPACE